MNREKLLLAAGCAAFLTAAFNATAQPLATAAAPPTPFAVPPYKNLQVLSKDITRDQLISNMKFFAQSLGVRCTHCHVGEEGKPLSTFDFASDAKPRKQTARAMLRMVHKINQEEFGVKEFKDVKVTCYTCHRGSTKPLTAPPSGTNLIPPPPPAPAPKASERG
jgi:photosynthetic reaction center cytochrome c subunit